MQNSLDNPRRHVSYHPEHVSNVSSTDFPGYYPGEEHSWDLERFKKNLSVKVQRLSQVTVEFDVVGVDASIANAFRRILMAEVPTMAIETVYLWDNTSVIHDEVLSARLGLVPIAADPGKFQWKKDGAEATDQNTLVFTLKIKCERNKNAKKGETDSDKLYINSKVYSRDLIFKPAGRQGEMFPNNPPRAANGNILLAKLRPGQEMDMELHAFKGTGDMHAKWSPVATATYRLLPHIIIKKPIPAIHAQKFQSCFAPGVIELTEDNEVVVANPRLETMSREVLRHKEFEGLVELTRIRDYFMFSIESTGCIPPEKLFPESVSVMRTRISKLRESALKLLATHGASTQDIEMEE